MGKRKIQTFDKIQNLSVKNITFSKRKKGVIKKAMELSHLCDQDVLVAFYNKDNKKLVLYQSTPDFNPLKINEILVNRDFNEKFYEEHTNQDYQTNENMKQQTFDLIPESVNGVPYRACIGRTAPKRHWKISNKQMKLDDIEVCSEVCQDDIEMDYMQERKYQKIEDNQSQSPTGKDSEACDSSCYSLIDQLGEQNNRNGFHTDMMSFTAQVEKLQKQLSEFTPRQKQHIPKPINNEWKQQVNSMLGDEFKAQNSFASDKILFAASSNDQSLTFTSAIQEFDFGAVEEKTRSKSFGFNQISRPQYTPIIDNSGIKTHIQSTARLPKPENDIQPQIDDNEIVLKDDLTPMNFNHLVGI